MSSTDFDRSYSTADAWARQALDDVDAWAAERKLPQPTRFRIKLILDEYLANLRRHADLPEHAEACTLYLDFSESRVLIRLEDRAAPFNPLELESPDLSIPIEDRLPGGLGIHLIRRFADDIDYRCENGKNILTVLLNVDSGSSLKT